MSAPINLQHVNVKLLASNSGGVDLEPLIPVFHRWIRDRVFEELLLDVADYRHVHEGPGVMLIGHQANYSVDNTNGRLGVRYNRKTPLDGSNQDRLKQAARSAMAAFVMLESEPNLAGTLKFNGHDVELLINDRLMAPNSDATREAARPELGEFFEKLFHGTRYSVSHGSDPRGLFALQVRAERSFSLAELVANLEL